MKIKTVVFGVDSNGTSAWFPCIINCQEEDIKEGKHFLAAGDCAKHNGYDPQSHDYFMLDEQDALYKTLVLDQRIHWNSVSEYEI